MEGWKGSGEERDNKAGGDVNSQIGSFSCFPQPATLDGWLRQRPERIRETRAPPESRGCRGGMKERGAAGAWLGSAGKELPRAAGKGMAPGHGNSWGNRRKIAQTVYSLPCLQPLSSGSQRARSSTRALWVTGGARSFHPWGLGWRREAGNDYGFQFSLSFLHCFLSALTPSAIFPIFTFCSIFPLFSLSLFPLFLSSIFPSCPGDISWL